MVRAGALTLVTGEIDLPKTRTWSHFTAILRKVFASVRCRCNGQSYNPYETPK